MRVATDVGGTFTDLVYCEFDPATGRSGPVHAVKCDTTPPDFERGVLDAVAAAGIDPAAIDFFAHGTTVVINALLSRRGAKVGLITTRGFRDVLEIARGNRPDLFNYAFRKPRPFVPRHLRLEADERLDRKGEVIRPLDPRSIDSLVAHFRQEGVEAIAICFLHAFRNPTHEIAAAERVRALWPGVSVIASHEITREWREYERTSTAVLSAYVQPVAGRYLDKLDGELRARRLRGRLFVMQSNGGISTVDAAKANPISMVECGPASGMLGAVALGKVIGEQDLIALDIGGTTAKCALIHGGEARITTDYRIEWTRTHPGYPIRTPVIDLVEIGNGGGSVAWLDETGRLHVGPQSAGAVPGPAAYGRGGTEPTTTDANLLTGRIDPQLFVGGQVVPDMENLRHAFGRLPGRMGASIEDLARGIIRIANANMVAALKLVSVNRGYDPRDFTLVAFGGGGGMHAAMLAEEIGIRKVVVPPQGAVFSAWGMLMTDLRRDFIQTRLLRIGEEPEAAIEAVFAALEEAARRQLAEDGVEADRQVMVRLADLRYRGQEHTVKVALPAGDDRAAAVAELVARFHQAHERAYNFKLDYPVEIVNFHLIASGLVDKPELPRLERRSGTAADALEGRRPVDFDGAGIHDTPVYRRERLAAGVAIDGPAVVQEPSSTVPLPPGQRLVVDDYGNLVIHTGR